jgi:hypothetical protein
MGQKRGRDEGSFVRDTNAKAVEFYRDIVQHLRAWQPSAPQLHDEADPTDEAASIESLSQLGDDALPVAAEQQDTHSRDDGDS